MAMQTGHQKFVERGADPVTGSVTSGNYLNELFAQYGIDPVTGMILPGGGTGTRKIKIPEFPQEEPEPYRPNYSEDNVDYSGGPLGDTMVRTPENNFGWVDRGLALSAVGAFGGAVGKLANMVVNGNNVHAVNAARSHMGLAPLSATQALGGLAKGVSGKVADLEINGKQVSVSLSEKKDEGKSLRDVVQGAISSVFGGKKDEVEKTTMTVEEALAASKAAGLDQVVEVTPEGKKENGKRSLAEVLAAPVQQVIDEVLGRTPQTPTTPQAPVAPTTVTPQAPIDPQAPVYTPQAPQAPVQTGFMAPAGTVTSQPLHAPTATPVEIAAPVEPVSPTYSPQSGFITPSVPVTAMDYPAAIPVTPSVLEPVATPAAISPVEQVPSRAAPATPQAAPQTTSFVSPSLTENGISQYSRQEIAQMTAADPMGFRAPASTIDWERTGLQPAAQARMEQFTNALADKGIDAWVDVTNMTRTPEQQREIQSRGASRTGTSYHMSGMAVDISPLDEKDQRGWEAIREVGRDLGFGQLGSWDPAHHELNARVTGTGLNARDLMSMPRDEFGNIQFTPQQELAIRSSAVPTPDVNPQGAYAGLVDAPQGAFASGFMSTVQGVDPTKAFAAPTDLGLAPNQQLGPTTAEIYGWERTPDVRDQMARTIAGELGSKTISGIRSGDPNAIETARQEIAAIASTIDNRAFSPQYHNPADPREAYSSVLSGSQYNANLSRNQATTNQNYSLVGDFISQALTDYDLGMNPSPVPEATHYRSLDINSPSWENTKTTQVGEHTFSTSNLKDMNVAEYQPSVNQDAFTSFMEPSKASTPSTIDMPDGLLSPDMDPGAQRGFTQDFDIEAAKSAMSMEAPSPSPTAQAGTLGNTTSFLDEPTGMLSPENALNTGTKDDEKTSKEKESEKEENTTESSSASGEGGGEGSSSSSAASSSTSGGGESGGFSQSDYDQTSQSAGLW